MSHHRWHTIEKIQVQVAASAALVAAYLLLWRWAVVPDVDRVLTFVPFGAWGKLGALAGLTWLLSAGTALLTTTARPQGALLATLVGVGGVSLRSEPMQLLLMRFSPVSSLLVPLMVELACMAGIIIVAAVIIQTVRLMVHRVRPGWLRPLGGQAGPAGEAPAPLGLWAHLAISLTGYVPADPRHLPGPARKTAQTIGDVLVSALACLGLTLLIGLLLMTVLVFETSRGQLLFGLAGAFFVAAGVASYFFPTRLSAACWLAPLLLGLMFYVKASTVADVGVMGWAHVDRFAHILPIDWLSAGAGGAVGGYWLACRLHEMKLLGDKKDEKIETIQA